MELSYMDYICYLVKQSEIAKPIYSAGLAQKVAERFAMPTKKAAMATAVALKRILDGRLINDFRFYKKGIYYRTKVTPFGELGIDKEAVIADKYLTSDNGYESGLSLLHKWGLTTQIPNEKVIVTNVVAHGARKDKVLGIVTKAPKIAVNKDNKRYLQILDVLELLNRAPVDAEEPYQIIAELIDKLGLSYRMLLALAGEYYNGNTVKQLSKTAIAGGLAA